MAQWLKLKRLLASDLSGQLNWIKIVGLAVFKKDINHKKLKSAFDSVRSWDQWDAFTQEWFEIDNWPLLDVDRVSDSLNRPSRKIRGRIWEPYGELYDVDAELRFLSEKLRWEIFMRLEPDAAEDNRMHPGRYGWMCVWCRIYTRTKVAFCDQCKKELLPLPLNED